MLRAAVVHTPLLALNMSTVLTAALVPAQRNSNQQQRQQHNSPLPNTLPPPQTPPPAITDINTCNALEPPANIASPSFGSDVATSHHRATLRAAVVHTPLVALNMSTVLTAFPLAPAQRTSNQQQQQQQHTSPLPHTPPSPHHPLQSLTSTHTTHRRRRRISPVLHSAAMWLQAILERS